MPLDLTKSPNDYDIQPSDVVMVVPKDPLLATATSSMGGGSGGSISSGGGRKENQILLKIQSKTHGTKKFRISKVRYSGWPRAGGRGRGRARVVSLCSALVYRVVLVCAHVQAVDRVRIGLRPNGYLYFCPFPPSN